VEESMVQRATVLGSMLLEQLGMFGPVSAGVLVMHLVCLDAIYSANWLEE
jgi:hypothetical protein